MSAKPSDDVQTSLRWVSGAKVQQKSHSCKRNAIFIIERVCGATVSCETLGKRWWKCGAHYHTITLSHYHIKKCVDGL